MINCSSSSSKVDRPLDLYMTDYCPVQFGHPCMFNMSCAYIRVLIIISHTSLGTVKGPTMCMWQVGCLAGGIIIPLYTGCESRGGLNPQPAARYLHGYTAVWVSSDIYTLDSCSSFLRIKT
jgi:hypothetical protein